MATADHPLDGGDPQHDVTRALLGTLQPAVHDVPSAQTSAAILLDLHYTGASGHEPELSAIAALFGCRTHLVQGGIERIQGRALGRLRVRVEAPSGGRDVLLQQARQIADRVERVHA
ncbi:NIL domain-containing protein [Pseudomonas laurylsulfatiphila]|uniref:NIL domain-containing protein n=1 Tax=Pseudomonas laurylsulfatiphila TaxID=2011015 RepID=UPI003D1F5B88